MQHAAGDERRHHLPVARHHAIRRVGIRARWTQRSELLIGPHFEVADEPIARLSHPSVAAHFVQAEDQIHVVERRGHFFTTPMLTMVSPFFSEGKARTNSTMPAWGEVIS